MSTCDACIGGFDGETCEFFHEATPKARKVHRCSECDSLIKPGEKYQRVSGKSDGEIWTFDTCLLCAEIRKVFSCNEGQELGGLLWESMQEYAFPNLTTASPCFRELSAAAKEIVINRWNDWKFNN